MLVFLTKYGMKFDVKVNTQRIVGDIVHDPVAKTFIRSSIDENEKKNLLIGVRDHFVKKYSKKHLTCHSMF